MAGRRLPSSLATHVRACKLFQSGQRCATCPEAGAAACPLRDIEDVPAFVLARARRAGAYHARRRGHDKHDKWAAPWPVGAAAAAAANGGQVARGTLSRGGCFDGANVPSPVVLPWFIARGCAAGVVGGGFHEEWQCGALGCFVACGLCDRQRGEG